MVANLHIIHTNMANESRLLRETASIVNRKIADYIYIVGKLDEKLSEREQIDRYREIWRVNLKTKGLSKNLVFQIIKYIEFLISILLRYKNAKIQYVNCHSLSVLPVGFMFKILFKSRLIYDAHELETETYGLTGIRKCLSEFVERVLIRHVDQIFVVGDRIADEYAKKYTIKRPTVVLNCPKYARINRSNYFRDKFSIEDHALIFLYQGVLSEGRGVSLILDSFSKLQSDKYVVIFLGYGPLEDKVINFSCNFKNIYFHKAVHTNELLNYTACADIGLSLIEGDCLSYQYCLPNKLFEYIMSGLSVVITDMPEMKRIVESNRIGYVLHQNTTASLIQLIQDIDPEKNKELKKNAYKAAQIYNWEEQEKTMINAYSTLVR